MIHRLKLKKCISNPFFHRRVSEFIYGWKFSQQIG